MPSMISNSMPFRLGPVLLVVLVACCLAFLVGVQEGSGPPPSECTTAR